jgi:hypothetical protein
MFIGTRFDCISLPHRWRSGEFSDLTYLKDAVLLQLLLYKTNKKKKDDGKTRLKQPIINIHPRELL